MLSSTSHGEGNPGPRLARDVIKEGADSPVPQPAQGRDSTVIDSEVTHADFYSGVR